VWCSGPVRSINTGSDTDAGTTAAADDEDDEDEEDEDDDAVAGLSVCGSVYPGGYWWYFRYLVGTCSMSASPKVRSLTFGGTVGPMNTLNLQVGGVGTRKSQPNHNERRWHVPAQENALLLRTAQNTTTDVSMRGSNA